MSHQKKISIIVPCFNVTKTIDRCWDAIKGQTIGLDALECIFVDDASTDEGATWSRLLQIEKEAPEDVILIRHEKNMRQGGARNTAMRYVSGKYLKFWDADDVMPPDACGLLYEEAECNRADIVQFNSSTTYPSGKKETGHLVKCTETYDLDTIGSRKPFLTNEKVTYGCTNKMFRSDMVIRTGAGFAEHCIYEEPPFVYPQFLEADHVLLLEQCLYNSFLQETSSSVNNEPGVVMQHPAAQMKLLEHIIRNPGYLKNWHDEIEYYFLWTYLFETILFSERAGYMLSPDELQMLTENCRRVFPVWESNPYLEKLGPDMKEIKELLSAF